MNKPHKHKIFKNEYVIASRCNIHLDSMIKEWMEVQDCDRSTAVREILQLVLDMGSTELIQ